MSKMPYQRIGDANKAILGIKPRVTLAQANLIAEWAGAIAEENPDGAWQIAIAQFKRLYMVRGGKWVERKSLKKEQEAEMPNSLTIDVDGEAVAVDALIEAWKAQRDLSEATTKKVGGASYPASDFLVVEDPEQPSKWHLQVKKNGKPDRRLMGAAKAALTSPGGHRGQKYVGPNKSQAISKLKALYKSEGLDFNEAEAEENGEMPDPMMMVQGPTTFADLTAKQQAREAADEVYELTYQFQMLANNVMSSPDIGDKLAALKALAAEYVAMVEAALSVIGSPEAEEAEAAESDAPPVEELAESESGQAVAFTEAADGSPAIVDVEIIQPGWGNARDNHYYPADVLARDKSVFKGAKMYATDHRPDQKSVLTEVSTILDIVGLSERGAPIARVGVHNAEFANDVRNRAALNVLGELHCSILASGTARPFEKDGRKGKLVESITSVQSVDWVTRAGAGGHAVALVESAAEGGIADGVQDKVEGQAGQGQEAITQSANVQPGAEGGDPADAAKGAESEAVSEASVAGAAQPVTIAETAQPITATPEAWLTEADVTGELGKRPALHPAITARVATGRYHDLAELHGALEAEIAYYKQLTGSGQPFGQGAQQTRVQPTTAAEAESKRRDNFNRVMREIGMKEV